MIVAVASFTGGSGKSSITANVAAMLTLMGYRVGVADCDLFSPGIHTLFGLNPEDFAFSMSEAVLGLCSIKDVALDITESQLGLTKNDGALIFFPARLTGGAIAKLQMNKNTNDSKLAELLTDALDELDLDILLADTHPGVSTETLLAMSVANLAVLVMKPDNRDISGIEVTMTMARGLGLKDENKIVLAVNFVPKSFNMSQVVGEIEGYFNLPVVIAIADTPDVRLSKSTKLMVNTSPKSPYVTELRKLVKFISTDFEERVYDTSE